jgi:hypothetical protein
MVSTPIDSVACTELYLIVDPVAYNQLSLFIFIQNYTHLVAYIVLLPRRNSLSGWDQFNLDEA